MGLCTIPWMRVSYERCRFRTTVLQCAVWLYLRFTLSLRRLAPRALLHRASRQEPAVKRAAGSLNDETWQMTRPVSRHVEAALTGSLPNAFR